jgi:hypothetical protein
MRFPGRWYASGFAVVGIAVRRALEGGLAVGFFQIARSACESHACDGAQIDNALRWFYAKPIWTHKRMWGGRNERQN